MKLHRRHGLVLFAVLVIVGSAVLVATTVVFLVGGEVSGGANEREALRTRAAGLSAVHAVAARIGAQRSSLLEGSAPLVDREIVLWESPSETAIATLVPADAFDTLLVAENARVPLATATVESLVASGSIDERLAGQILAARDAGRAPASIDSLLAGAAGEGLAVEDLYGDLEQLARGLSVGRADQPADEGERSIQAGIARSEGRIAMRDFLTTLSFEPPVAIDGTPRLRLDVEWTDDHRGAVDALLGTGSADLLEAAMKEGDPTFASLFSVWRRVFQEPAQWHAFLDGVTLGVGPHEHRMDITRAGVEALRTLPGVSREIAERIVREREGLPVEARRSIAWIAERGILDADMFESLVDSATTRSLLWRFRVVVRIERPREAPQGRRAIFEAVVDCSEERPRITALRDLTGLETVAQMLLLREENAGDGSSTDELDPVLETFASDAFGEMLDEPLEEDPEESFPSDSDSAFTFPEGVGSELPPNVETPARRGVGRWRRAQ
jgi:hypothetical protein